MSKGIKNIGLKFVCNADWDRMEIIDGAKYCTHCQKKVYDFTNVKQQEFLKILAENNNTICGRFMAEQMAAKHPGLPHWKKWLSAAMVLIGVNIFNNKVDAQNAKPNVTKQKIRPIATNIVLGEPIPIGMKSSGVDNFPAYDKIAQFPGGWEAFHKFVKRNLNFNNAMKSGRVFVTFNINKNGTLSDYQIIRGLSTLNDNEVIRVLKLSPPWEPATLNGKPVSIPFTVPVVFEK